MLHGTDGKLQINTCDSDGKNSKVLVPHKAFEETPRFSPDGKKIAWVSTRFGNQEICATTNGSDVQRLTNDAGLPRRPWFKHLLYAPGVYSGYGVKTVPGVREGIEQKKYSEAEQEIVRVGKALQDEAALIDSAAQMLESK